MRPRMRLLKLREERDGPPTQSMNTLQRVKKTRKLGHIDPKAKKRTLLRRMRSIANTRQRKEIHLKAAAKAGIRVGGQKAERRVTSTKVMTEEVSLGAKTEMLLGKKRSQNLITVKIEIRVMSPIKSIKRIPKEEMVRELGRSHKARKEQLQKIGTDQVAGTGTEADLQHQKTKKKNEKKTERGAGSAAGVRKDDTTVKGRIRGEGHPGIRTIEQEVQTEISLETCTEAGAPEARVPGETTAKTGRLIGRTKTEKLPAKGEDVAAAQRAIKTRKGKVKRAQILNGAKPRAPPDPKTGEARPNRDQIVQKAKTGTTARGINRARAQALTATEPVMISRRNRLGVLKSVHILYKLLL